MTKFECNDGKWVARTPTTYARVNFRPKCLLCLKHHEAHRLPDGACPNPNWPNDGEPEWLATTFTPSAA